MARFVSAKPKRRPVEILAYALLAVLMLGLILVKAASSLWGSSPPVFTNGSPEATPLRLSARELDGIPRILHHVHIGKKDKPGEGPAKHSLAWMDSCKRILCDEAGWEYRLWDLNASEALIQQHAPEFLEAFQAYPAPIFRADAIRYFIMRHIGGLYLDADIECWREGYDMLQGYDVVLSGDYPEAAATNGAIASKPGHPLWDVAVELLKERKEDKEVTRATGPPTVRDSVKRLFNVSLEKGLLPSELTNSDSSRVRVYQLGNWFTPCGFGDRDCHLRIMLERATGRANLSHLVGYHRYTATWLGFPEGLHGVVYPEPASKAFCEYWNKTAGKGTVHIAEKKKGR